MSTVIHKHGPIHSKGNQISNIYNFNLLTKLFQSKRIRRLKIDRTWNGQLLEDKDKVDFHLETRSGTGLMVKVNVPFYDDVPPPFGPSGWPFQSLSSSYEFASLFLVARNNVEALEIQLGP